MDRPLHDLSIKQAVPHTGPESAWFRLPSAYLGETKTDLLRVRISCLQTACILGEDTNHFVPPLLIARSYERKIRELSPPHKVFEYFASQVTFGENASTRKLQCW